MWLNITVHAQSELFATIRQLEFALLRLIQQVDELSNAIQSAIHGSLSISLINPTVLLYILKNVSLQIPSGYELIAGIRAENIHLYYELVKVSVAATPHCIKLIISVPLKGTDRHFTLYKIVTLPEQISFNRFFFYIWFITLTSAFTAISSTTLSLRKSSIIITLQAALLYVRYTLPFITPGLYLVHLVCTFRAQVTIDCVKGNYCYTNKHRFSKNMAHIAFIIFRRNVLSPYAAPGLPDSWLARYHFTGLSYCIKLRGATFPPANFAHY